MTTSPPPPSRDDAETTTPTTATTSAATSGKSHCPVLAELVDHEQSLDETALLAATATSARKHVTGIVDVTRGRAPRLLDVVPGRSGKVYADWIAQRDAAWREGIALAALDPFRGCVTALRTELPDAVRLLECFHVVCLGFACVDEVRRRVQQETLHRRWAPRRPALPDPPGAAPPSRPALPARPPPP